LILPYFFGKVDGEVADAGGVDMGKLLGMLGELHMEATQG